MLSSISAYAEPARAVLSGKMGLMEGRSWQTRLFDNARSRSADALAVRAISSPVPPELLFSDQGRISERLVAEIDNARTSIEIAIHGLTIRSVTEALLRAKEQRGVNVRVIMNQTHVFPEQFSYERSEEMQMLISRSEEMRMLIARSEEIQMLIDHGVEMRTLRGSGSYGIMHNKFAVFDGKRIVAGSYNWTRAADEAHFENIFFVNDPGRVESYIAYWEWMWKLAKPLRRGGAPILEGSLASPPQSPDRPVRFHGKKFPSQVFSPGGGTKNWLIRAVDSAQTSIDLAMFCLTLNEMQGALLKAKERGVRVRIVFDRAQARGQAQMRWFAEQGFDVRFSNGKNGQEGVMHHKFAVFDGELVETGSFNWTGNAEDHNYENANFFDDPGAAASYQAEFERVFSRASIVVPDDWQEGETLLGYFTGLTP